MIHISKCIERNMKELIKYKEPEQKEIVKATPEMFLKIRGEINKVGKPIK